MRPNTKRLLTSLFLIAVFVFFADCKRRRKIDVSGVVTDTYTGQPLANLRLGLFSQLSNNNSTNEYSEYYVYTNSNGEYTFDAAYFSKPNFYGYTAVKDANGVYTGLNSEGIDESDARLIGKSKITRNLEALCISKLYLGIVVNSNYNWNMLKITQKFIGTHPIAALSDFDFPLFFYTWSGIYIPGQILGYADGKTILRTELFDTQNVLLKTGYDTIVSNGCGVATNYTITVN